MDITINVDALDKTQAVVNSASDRTAVTEMELLVVGNRVAVTLRFCDSAGATPAFVTDASTVVDLGLGLPDVDGRLDYASTTSLSVSGSTRTGSLDLDGAALRTAVYNAIIANSNNQRLSQAPFILEVRTTTSAGLVQTRCLQRVFVAFRVMPLVLDDSQGDGFLAVLYNPSTGRLARPTAIAYQDGGVPAGGTSGYVLTKLSGADYDVGWAAGGGGGGGGTWGSITGTLSDQTDLQAALDAKQNVLTFGTGVVTALAVNVGSAGSFVVNGGALGTPSSGTVTNLTGTASININGTVGATTPSSGAFTTLTATGLTAGRVPFITTGGLFTSSSSLLFNSGTGVLTSGALSVGAGAQSSLALRFTSDTDTGIYSSASNEITFVTGGSAHSAFTITQFIAYPNSSASAPFYSFNGFTGYGMWCESGVLGFAVAGSEVFRGTSAGLRVTGAIDLNDAGDTTISRVSAGVIAVEGATVYTQGGALGTPGSGTLTNCTGLPVSTGISGLGTGVATALAVNVGSAGAFVTTSSTDTLTNKRITKRVVTESDATSITPTGDTADVTYQANTQSAGTLTVNAPTGTPTNGQPWVLKLHCTNIQTFSWNAIYAGGTVALPTATTGGGKIDYYSFLYDAVDSKWHFVGNALGF